MTHPLPVIIEGVRRYFQRNDLYLVSLWHESERRLLMLLIGQPEAYVIVMGMQNIPSPRPTTLHFMANTLRAMQVQLEEVHIEQLKMIPMPVFYAVAYLKNGDIQQELDVRPGDALGLAVLLERPVMVSGELFAEAGIILPEDKTPEIWYAEQVLKQEGISLTEGQRLRLGYRKTPAADAVIREVKSFLLGVPQPPSDRELEQAKRQYLAFLLGQSQEVESP